MTHPTLIRIGTRRSQLALAQANQAAHVLQHAFPTLACELVPMMTTGDRNTDRTLADIGGKGLFTKELEECLLDGRIDIAVHSLKDMETHLAAGMIIACVLPREDPRDAFISRDGMPFSALPQGARVGTSSMRRAAQMAIHRPDLEIVPFRGNVTTRLAKLHAGEVDATLLALAGLKRLGREEEVSEILDTARFIPAAGQGTIAIECCRERFDLMPLLAAVNHEPSFIAMRAERAVLAAIDGSCRTPIGAHATLEGGRLKLNAMVARTDGSEHAATSREGSAQDAERLGRDAGEELLARGGRDWFR